MTAYEKQDHSRADMVVKPVLSAKEVLVDKSVGVGTINCTNCGALMSADAPLTSYILILLNLGDGDYARHYILCEAKRDWFANFPNKNLLVRRWKQRRQETTETIAREGRSFRVEYALPRPGPTSLVLYSRVSTMDLLPIETWQTVFSYACTDGGLTAASLAITCRYFRDAIKPIRFQSVKLVGMTHLLSFSRFLEEEQELRIRYLFVSDRGECNSIPLQKDRDAALVRILQKVSPTIEILFLDLQSGRDYLLSPVSLPALRELGVYGTYSPDDDTITPSLEPFHNLRRLHFSGTYDLHSHGPRVGNALVDVTRLAPSLTHLGSTSGSIVALTLDRVARALGILNSPNAQRVQIPATVTHVYMKPHKFLHAYREISTVRNLAARDGSAGAAPTDVLDPYANWSAAVQGREGMWAHAVDVASLRNSQRLDRFSLMI
ncbi:hypothetical protein GLOTRDRAFT_122278 [Gloeophyllum trabeum ATCC 11539]|uniref:F-box domain-containing protein n=1 Tax=Gloeophyllum trabeum (strain ATCC 11539 / FP-39264 / Madison 617) TaxID=670483 RepID=S7Q2K6_GLOTA|nr:uncharacterized protein GLOTRDRAFT_122278 [Gloeophyllum trabeum ATCC 11539]EPQ53782.1 hypothetical protein GLOTRDRAFT_122278 [Gloeophyllum trabeum ATCC 11539]